LGGRSPTVALEKGPNRIGQQRRELGNVLKYDQMMLRLLGARFVRHSSALENILTELQETSAVPANFVPAAAAKRGVLALFIVTGRKGSVGSFVSLYVVNNGKRNSEMGQLILLSF